MTKEKHILILSDSSSTTLGLERKIHHMLLADRNIWPKNTTLINFSIPGMTSADASVYFKIAYRKYSKSIVSVFIYLGNCDTISTEFVKGGFSNFKFFKLLIINKFFVKRKKIRLRNRLFDDKWNNNLDLSIENPEDPNNFKRNIKFIIRSCKKKSIPVILVKTSANKNFIPGIAKGNFLFYKYLNFYCKFSSSIKHPDERFNSALSLHDNKHFSEAASAYKNILNEPLKKDFSLEYTLLLLNNYAVAKAEINELEEAKFIFDLLINEKNSRKEIAIYNLAQIAKKEGIKGDFIKKLKESYENDYFLYRIRSPYQIALEEIYNEEKFIKYIDLDKLLLDEDYLDHCHPLPSGQKKLADHLEQLYGSLNICGYHKATIENDLYNPELANGVFTNFKDYFKSVSSISSEDINDQFKDFFKLKDNRYDSIENTKISRSIEYAFNYYFKHPLFVKKEDIESIKTFYGSDIGRFPEFLFYRYLIPYLKQIELNDPLLFESYNQETKLVHSFESFKQLLIEHNIIGLENSVKIIPFKKEKISRILEKIEAALLSHTAKGEQIYNRTKSTIFWYFRETLRFGSHSRYSMRYDRVLIEYISEALIICEYYNNNLGYGFDKKIAHLKEFILSIVRIHEENCKKFNLQKTNINLIKNYNKSLQKMYNQLK